MRDPLRNVSVRYKLALTFLVVCLLAFGVGGFLVSRSARESLEREILAFLHFQSQVYAAVLEGNLRALGWRARDFASDGYIRNRFAELEFPADAPSDAPSDAPLDARLDTGGLGEDLRRHLLENKLPLEPAFANLALVDAAGERKFLAFPDDSGWVASLPAAALGGADWFSGLVAAAGPDAPPSVILATPLRSLDGSRQIGSLLVRLHSAVWIAGSLASLRLDPEPSGPEISLRLVDNAGRSLEIPRALLSWPGDAAAPWNTESMPGLRLREPDGTRAPAPTSTRGVLAQSFPVKLNGWSLETSLGTKEALRPVSGLQARFLMVGLALTGAASVLLFFPMRFLARPIRQLRDAALHIRGGDFAARVPVESGDEIGELSDSFNLMAEAVEERAEALKATARSLEQRKDELSKERDRMNAVIHSMRDGLMVLDADGKPEVWNAAAEPLLAIVESGGLELSAHRLCQREIASRQPGSNGSPDVDHPCLTCLFEPAAPPRSCMLTAGPLVYEVHSTRLSSEPDGRSGRVLVARDVTDRVQEDEREIHQERLAVLGEVAAIMAHELNNPLAAISMFTQMIAAGLPADSALHGDITVIERNVKTCSRTIRELLDYATGSTPEVGPVDVHEGLREVASFLRALRERKDVDLELMLQAHDPVVVGDEVQLRQVFVNLVLNALQAVGQGHVCIRTWIDGAHLVVDVQDDGPGIPDEIVDTVFRPFFTTKPRGSGTGLGLSTARRITEIQGGGLELADSRPGQTTFRVRLLRGKS